ncbi:MAG: asparagine synthase-related protein, partial [Bdellovibrionota bacterium]
LDALWERSIRGRMISDVPLGTLLSGGIDSGFIAQSMEPLADGPITAMTYEVPGKLSEVRASRLLADELGYAHSVVSHRGDFFQQLPEVIRALEEPLGDSIVVPNYELFKESRKKMTVVVSGEGADEIFGGYAHHRILKSLFDLQSAGLKPALSFAAKAIPWISPRALSKLIPYPVQFDGALLDRAQALLGAPKPQDSYDTARTLIDEPELAKLLDPQFRGDVNKGSATWNDGAPWTQVLLSDIHGWLPNYGLLRVDKLSMAHGLECRVPYLQHEFAEAALAMTVREASRVGFPVKRVLRDLVRRRYPHSSYARRRKQPFFLPTEKTRDRALEDLVDNYLSEGALKKTGIFSPSAVHRLMKGPDSFLKAKKMVSILHLQIWMDVFRVSIS